LDHIGIYILIAGTYTPFMLIGLHHRVQARILLVAEWLAAAFGTGFAGRL
jgi:channel protein (hemolysin III family)